MCPGALLQPRPPRNAACSMRWPTRSSPRAARPALQLGPGRSETGKGGLRAVDGVSVDPTNDERRDAAAGEARNLRKVASDFCHPGFARARSR